MLYKYFCLLQFRRIEKNSVRTIDHTEHWESDRLRLVSTNTFNLFQISGHSKIKRDINESNFCHKIWILDNYSFCMKMNRYCILDLATGYDIQDIFPTKNVNEDIPMKLLNGIFYEFLCCANH